MRRHIRYIVHQKVGKSRQPVGLFAAGYRLLQDGDMDEADYQRLAELLKWFEDKLPVPPKHLIPEDARFWYSEAGPFSERMWELAHLLGEYGYTAELITATFVGRIVYQDEYQLAATPPSRNNR